MHILFKNSAFEENSLKINSEVNFLTDASITAFPPDSLRWLLFLR